MSFGHIVCRFIATIFILMPATGFAQSMGDSVRTVSLTTTAPTRLGVSNFTPWPGRATSPGLRLADANSCLSSGNKLCGNGACYDGMTTTCCQTYPQGVAACENGAACCGGGCCGPDQACGGNGLCYAINNPNGSPSKPNPSGALPITPPVGAPVPVRVDPPPAAVPAPPPASVPVRAPPTATLPTPQPAPSAVPSNTLPVPRVPTVLLPVPTLPAPAPPPSENWIACVVCRWNDPDGTARAAVGCSGKQKTELIAESEALQAAHANGGQNCSVPVAINSGCLWAASGQGAHISGTGGGSTAAQASANCQAELQQGGGGTCQTPVGGCASPAAVSPAAIPPPSQPSGADDVGPGCILQCSN